ncbi:MAG TPA: hypothetical protein VIR16_08240, partial [Candidatus Limnocylindrales bacterium]
MTRSERPLTAESPSQPVGQRPHPAESLRRSDDSFPLARVLEALERWQAEPSPDSRAAVARSLEGVLSAAGARGAVLEIAAPPLPPLELGAGTLSGVPPESERAGLAQFALGRRHGHQELGRLILDAPESAE